jgi:hypothetical protein
MLIKDLNKLYIDFNHKAGFLTVYITEAHTQDEWPMGDDILLECQPTEIEERSQVACEFREDTGYIMPMAVDTMENDFDNTFGAWPVRFFIVQDNVLVYKAQPNSQFTYELQEIRDWLMSH